MLLTTFAENRDELRSPNTVIEPLKGLKVFGRWAVAGRVLLSNPWRTLVGRIQVQLFGLASPLNEWGDRTLGEM